MKKANKRANGEGSLFQRTDGRWEARFYTPDKKRKAVYGSTQAEAISKRTEYLQQMARGEFAEPSKLIVSEWLLKWWNTYYKPAVAPGTASKARNNINTHLIPSLGSIQLQSLRTDHIQAMINRLQAQNYAPATIKGIYTTLLSALNQAEDNNLIVRNPARKAKLPKIQQQEISILTPDESRQLLEALPDTDNARIIRLMLWTGMRIGEAIGLRWKDIKGHELLKVEQSIVMYHDYDAATGPKVKSHTKSPKSEAGRRPIPQMQRVVSLLDDQKKAQLIEKEYAIKNGLGWERPELVFTTPLGKPKDRQNIARTLREAVKKAGIIREEGGKKISPHSLRHTFLTNMANTPGVSPKTLSEMAGHSKVAFTLQVYTHSSLDDKKAAIEALEAAQAL